MLYGIPVTIYTQVYNTEKYLTQCIESVLHQTFSDFEYIIVDNGCTVLDVVVEHPVYGELVGALQLKSRYDVSQFILQSHKARPLSLLTEGVHLHTIACPDEEAYRRVREALGAAGYLLAT